MIDSKPPHWVEDFDDKRSSNKKRFGFGSLITSGLLGCVVGLFLAWPDPIKFIDQDEAEALAIDIAQYVCERDHEEQTYDCAQFHVAKSQEQKEGWLIDIAFAGNQPFGTIWVDRAGGYDLRGRGDFDPRPTIYPPQYERPAGLGKREAERSITSIRRRSR